MRLTNKYFKVIKKKNETGVTLRSSSNLIGYSNLLRMNFNSDEEPNFPYELLLTDGQLEIFVTFLEIFHQLI